MTVRQYIAISVLLIVSSLAIGFVFYGNYALGRENVRFVAEMLFETQAQAAELRVTVQELRDTQIQLQAQLAERQTSAASRVFDTPGHIHEGAMLINFAALDRSADDIIDLRPESQSETAYGRKTPDEYWEELQAYAASNEYLRLNPQKQQKFLENGADLVQKLEEVETKYRIDAESIQFIEAQLGEGGIDAIESLYKVKKQLAGYVSEGKQYRRELDAMLQQATTPATLPKVTHQLPRAEGRTSEFYHPALADRWVLCDDANNFLIKLRFVYRSQVGGFPKIANVEDTINLRTMQSINGSYHYPDYFMREIYTLVRQNFRDGFLKFHGLSRKDEQLQQFLTLIR